MAESKFLQYQDVNGDGMIDVCDELVEVPEEKCPGCVPNPYAIVPLWHKRKLYEPFLNEKVCKFQITKTTKYKTTGAPENATKEEADSALKTIFDEHVDQIINVLLDVNNKDKSEDSINLVKSEIDYSDWYLDFRPKSRLKLLYSVPFVVIDGLPAAEFEDDEDAEDSDVVVTYYADRLHHQLTRIRKGIHLYNRHLKVMQWQVNSGDSFAFLRVEDDIMFDLESYGDNGLTGESIMSDILPQLESFLNSKGYKIPYAGGPNLSKKKVYKLEFTFSEEYELKKLVVTTADCPDDPIIFIEGLNGLKSKSAWKDSTAVAYFARLDEMEIDLTAREPLDWIEFIKKYTYPEVYELNEYLYESSGASCVGEALAAEGKQLGQDILDTAFGIGDALAYQFHKNLCMCTPEEVREYQRKIGWTISDGKLVEADTTIKAAAKAQAYETLENSDSPFIKWCGKFLKDPDSAFNELYVLYLNTTLDELKLCGLLDFLSEAIQCLLGGLTLEEGLATMLDAAMRAMSIENFNSLYSFLPKEDQEALTALVNQKLESGDLPIMESTAIDEVVGNSPEVSMEQVMEDQDAIDLENENMQADSYYYMTPSEYDASTQQKTETLAPTATGSMVEELAGGDMGALSSKSVVELYAKSILELFKGRELELVDQLNKFPGAPLIANILAVSSCPSPPLFEPSFIDFIRDFDMPWCCDREITWPSFNSLRRGSPFWKNFLNRILEAALQALVKLLVAIVAKLMIKLCEIIGDAICKALEVAGAVAVAAISPANTVRDAIKESICGDEVDDETIDNTVAEMFAIFGVGGEAFADSEALTNFTVDISSATTRKEISQAFLGEPSNAFIGVVEGLIEFEYPQYASALPNTQSIGSMFKNMGNLMPAEFRANLQNFIDELPENELVPANPSLCLTPEQAEQFCDIRAQLLQGRVTPDQIQKLCDRQAAIDDLAALSNVMEGNLFGQLPPITSDPGCDNGLVPYEPEELIEAATTALDGELESLKARYSIDMLGNGPGGEANWGLLNMVLSDTLGNPITAHHRMARNRKNYTDFNIKYEPDFSISLTDLFPVISLLTSPPTIYNQRGAYPQYVAEWMADEIKSLDIEFSSNNEYQGDITTSKTFNDLNLNRWNWGNVTLLPDLGYNIGTETDSEAELVRFTEKGRKKTPDLKLNFEDNAKGLKERGKSEFSYAFRIEMYLADLEQTPGQSGNASYEDGHIHSYDVDADGNGTTSYNDGHKHDITQGIVQRVCEGDEECHDHTLLDYSYGASGEVHNKPFDNVRFKIIEKFNEKASIGDFAGAALVFDPTALAELAAKNLGKQVIEEEKYEFLATDDTLAGIDTSDYIEFTSAFETKQSSAPQVILLKEMLNNSGGSFSNDTVENYYNSFMSEIVNNIFQEVANNSEAFNYGAEYDSLVREDASYVVDDGQTNSAGGTPYSEALVTDPETGEERGIRNKDMILGISAMQYRVGEAENRIFYLDPNLYGGRYVNPPLYVKPLQNKGWMGFVNILFPELCPCKPQSTDLVNFGQIQDMVNQIYINIPDDERLQQDPDCALEAPYNRILDRSAVAGLQGLIMAAIRIYASTHLIKSLATFTKFSPRFTEVFSSSYAAYVIEDMEESFKDAQPDREELFSTFKDEEFWYAFLEQSVQMYARRVEDGDIEAPDSALRALRNLNIMQKDYEFPTKDNFKVAKDDGETNRIFFKQYKSDETLAAVKETEEDAKVILKELVIEQLNYMGKTIVRNLETIDMKPDVHDLDYYLLERLTQGSKLTVEQDIQPSYPDLPDSGEEHYTNGNQFVVGEDNNSNDEFTLGEEYVGYYHVGTDENGDIIYMAGVYHDEEDPHDVLHPMAHMTHTDVGDVEEYPFTASSSTTQPFVIEKYISINGVKTNPTEAVAQIKANETTLNISDVYPGTLETVEDSIGYVLGLTGELGVRYGLLFSIMIGSRKYNITEVEIDALDLTIGAFKTLEANSKLLLCLVKHLKDDDRFKLISRYIFSLPKITSTVAIYNDMAFLPSIGETTVDNGETFSIFPIGGGLTMNSGDKPGVYADVTTDEDNIITNVDTSKGNAGWASLRDRSLSSMGPGGLLVREWDNWDQVLLRKSKRTIKRQFKNYYNSREWSSTEVESSSRGPGQVLANRLKGGLAPPSGQRILPWWRRRKLRSNPFNTNGELCEKED